MKAAPLGFFLIALAASSALAAHTYPEKYYQAKWCAAHHGQAEVALEEQTRADCITTTHAIEFDFGKDETPQENLAERIL